jgi:hypothetical protein
VDPEPRGLASLPPKSILGVVAVLSQLNRPSQANRPIRGSNQATPLLSDQHISIPPLLPLGSTGSASIAAHALRRCLLPPRSHRAPPPNCGVPFSILASHSFRLLPRQLNSPHPIAHASPFSHPPPHHGEYLVRRGAPHLDICRHTMKPWGSPRCTSSTLEERANGVTHREIANPSSTP